MRGATSPFSTILPFSLLFQSTPLCEGRHLLQKICLIIGMFQSTPLCEGRLPSSKYLHPWGQFQSTPLCEGRPTDPKAKLPRLTVSIHAPMRGATIFFRCSGESCFVSIHAPMRGATVFSSFSDSLSKFQSTPLCEGRQVYYKVYKKVI